jgi:hypothetical protein
MVKTSKIEVNKKSISIVEQNNDDYICLTDMVRGEEGEDHIRNWMRNRNTVEFIGLWETLHNPDFKPVEFDTLKQAGFRMPAGSTLIPVDYCTLQDSQPDFYIRKSGLPSFWSIR